jgi:hypothetical protein
MADEAMQRPSSRGRHLRSELGIGRSYDAKEIAKVNSIGSALIFKEPYRTVHF